ncbi:MAG TPA: hypothetical protein VFR18_06345 [Terriglobia bacterium]|nr:hypothetical protein [Terriglobia bacterium]
MKTRLYCACLALLIGISTTSAFLACGDKFLVATRGTRYQKAPVKREPHAILIWSNPTSELAKGLAGVPVDDTLRKVGYQPTTVTSAADFDTALNRGGWDLVIFGLDDASAVAKRLSGNAPVLLPVAHNATDNQLRQARTGYTIVLKGPAKKDSFLTAVDQALARKTKKSAAVRAFD